MFRRFGFEELSLPVAVRDWLKVVWIFPVTGEIYDGYEKVSNTNCICKVKQSSSLNSKIVGIICSEDKFASHGDVLVKVVPDTYELGDILCPDDKGYGKKASETDLMYMMLHAIPRPKITSLDTAVEGYVACFLV